MACIEENEKKNVWANRLLKESICKKVKFIWLGIVMQDDSLRCLCTASGLRNESS